MRLSQWLKVDTEGFKFSLAHVILIVYLLMYDCRRDVPSKQKLTLFELLTLHLGLCKRHTLQRTLQKQ